MDTAMQFLTHTPAWVYVLFAYLVYRGIRACKPGETSLLSLAIIPALFTAFGLYTLLRQYGAHVPTLGLWLVALLVGAGIGTLLVRGSALRADRARRVIHRPADYTVLPLMLLAFAAKYTFGAMLAVAPEQTAQPWFGWSRWPLTDCSPESSSASSCAMCGCM